MRKKSAAICAILAIMLGVAGCGGASGNSTTSSYDAGATEGSYVDYAAEEAAADGDDYNYSKEASPDIEGSEGDASNGGGESDSALRAQDGQKIVYTASLSIQSLEYDKSVASIRRKIKENGGFTESESEYDKDYNWYSRTSSSTNTRSINMTARIPSEKFEAFLDSLSGDGKIMSRSVQAQNISQTYANKESYKKALEKEQERLLAMMDKAETIDEMIAVESRLSEVERQLNSYKTDLSAMDKDVQYSTIYIELQEVKRYSEEVPTVTFTEKIKYAFDDAISDFKGFCEGVVLFVVRNFPFLIIFIILLVLFIRYLGRRRARKVALLTNPEYAKVMTAKVQAKAEAEARKYEAREKRRSERKGLFGKKKAAEEPDGKPAEPVEAGKAAEPGTAAEGPAEKPAEPGKGAEEASGKPADGGE